MMDLALVFCMGGALVYVLLFDTVQCIKLYREKCGGYWLCIGGRWQKYDKKTFDTLRPMSDYAENYEGE